MVLEQPCSIGCGRGKKQGPAIGKGKKELAEKGEGFSKSSLLWEL